MAGERDLQNNLAIRYLGWASLNTGDTETFGVVDTSKMRNLAFMVAPEEAIEALDDVGILIEDSPDNITWTQVADNKLLPADGSNDIVVATTGVYTQVVGVASHDRYVRLSLIATMVDKAHQEVLLIDVAAIMVPEQLAMFDWDPIQVLASTDGNP